MPRIRLGLIICLLVLPGLLQAGTVYQVDIDGIIDPAVANYVKGAIEQAEAEKAECLVITLDTPGGMLDATKEIVQLMLDADVPVVVFVSPRGASATSAGMMITIGAHVAVMAHGTNIGAAHPVMMPFMVKYEPVPKEDVMMEKATEDTAGWVRSIAQVRQRNEEWVEKAVRESSSITAREAVDRNVVDGMAGDIKELMEFLHGRKVKLNNREVALNTKGTNPVKLNMSLPQLLQHFINNPNVILILLLIGALGIAIEFKAPGMIFPAAIGAACILVALTAPTLPINYIGLLLIFLGFAFLIMEIFITSYGFLSLAGVVSLVIGALMLFQTKEVTGVQVSWSVLLPIVVFVVATILIVGTLILKAHRSQVTSGQEGLVGMIGVAQSEFAPGHKGSVFVNGEYWNAIAEDEINKGEEVKIVSVDNLVCRVRKA
jgi:membrane-bound serine protease (ClpP class)